jgi:hypothetical protein
MLPSNVLRASLFARALFNGQSISLDRPQSDSNVRICVIGLDSQNCSCVDSADAVQSASCKNICNRFIAFDF